MKKKKPEKTELIVSIESRKGGVGKTTAALCLGRVLHKSGYAVLVLDLDVTGTDAADIATSPFWKEDLHIICEPQTGDESDNVELKPLNFLTLFDRYFMAGLAVQEFGLPGDEEGKIRVDLEKVNILGSHIYRVDRSHDEKQKHKGMTCIERPGILFDDIHTLWMLEFVKKVIGNFIQIARTANLFRTAILIDNSPGYVGIVPAIHNWLTDRGPEVGKFLTVTSLDTQDLNACARAVDAVHDLYTGKWKTSRQFLEAGKKGSRFTIEQDQEAFFIRLATSSKGKTRSADPLAFFRSTASSRQRETPGEAFCNYPSRYIAALINRVPRSVKGGNLPYEFSAFFRSGTVISELLGCNKNQQRSSEYMVSYDEYIENQFLLQSLHRGRKRPERQLKRLIESLEMAEHELLINDPRDVEKAFGVKQMDGKYIGQMREQLVRANTIVNRARSAIDDAGLGHLSRLIHDEWLPGSIIPSFRYVLTGVLRESDFPYFEMMPFEFDMDRVGPETRGIMKEIKKRILMELRHTERNDFSIDDQISGTLAGMLATIVGLSFPLRLWHSPMEMEVAELFAGILGIELHHWREQKKRRSSKYSIQQFLAQETIENAEVEKERMKKMRFFFRHSMREEETVFVDFYKACTSTQARLIDFIADSRFIIQLLQFIVKEERDRGALFPFVRGVAEAVIVDKTIRHEEAPKNMASALQTVEYYREFDDVLKKVMTNWQVKNG